MERALAFREADRMMRLAARAGSSFSERISSISFLESDVVLVTLDQKQLVAVMIADFPLLIHVSNLQ